MNNSIKREYFEWLCSLIENDKYDERIIPFLKFLHSIPFRFVHPSDKNREDDGLNLRTDFRDRFDYYEYPRELNGPCTVLEFLIALAMRMDYLLSEDIDFKSEKAKWFWLLISNLRLDTHNKKGGEDYNSKVLNRFMDRQYSAGGNGGLFPLSNPTKDQRTVEIWYQMHAYMNEMDE